MTALGVNDLDDDLFSPSAIHDPYAYLARIREVDPVHWNELHQLWIVTRYDDVVSVLRQPKVFSSAKNDTDRPPYPPIDPKDEPAHRIVRANIRRRLTEVDPPEHRDHRGALKGYFMPSAVERWRGMIRSASIQLLDTATASGEMDVVNDFAVPLPMRVISELMAIPEADRQWVREVAQDMPIGPLLDEHRMSRIANAMQELSGYLAPLAEARARDPQDDLISVVMAGEKAGMYDREVAMHNLLFLVVAGHETTINLINNGVLAFIQNPAQWDRLRSDPTTCSVSATEEVLRYDSPVKSIERVAAADMEVGGKLIREGDRLRVFLASANRDPARFEKPDLFDISRSGNSHMAFGFGIHVCLGLTIARLEGQEVFAELGRRFQRLQLLTDPLSYAPTAELRVLNELRVTW